ncbi:hypothetical protein ALI144C_50565 [Actinosynnema sp. ALI-1.44]|uniref:asparagine synthase-related protein n=1 Tax=Actinosynnema sp. ALI-1.44 TaxID=1933779 RepID=UPI00097BD26F|nr:asparagine synthase-related protein [Actinosynnema sp. ALI-1.44]ONI70842.1 hypothetical protein ALI144C_50565 [Actinosynnema sp. ALI-1.44]
MTRDMTREMPGIAGGVDFTAGSRSSVSYSGELHNRAELRDSLTRLGHTFATGDDVEVVRQAYVEWGPDLVSRLDGVYAFAIWDSRARELVMVRDRLGVKPLYYYPTRDGVLFGTSPTAILDDPSVPRVVDVDGLRGLVTSTRPPWRGMRSLGPGQIVTLSRAGARADTYWRAEPGPHNEVELPAGRSGFSADTAALADPALRRKVVAAYDMPMGFGAPDLSLCLLLGSLPARSTVVLPVLLADEVFGAAHCPPGDRLALMCPHLRGHLAGADPGAPGFARTTIERVDRIATAAGLRVRLPYADHRLIPYIDNSPWARRVPTPDPRYNEEIQRQAKEVLADRDHLAMSLIDWDWLTDATAADPATMPGAVTSGIDWILDLYHWVDMYDPTVERPG